MGRIIAVQASIVLLFFFFASFFSRQSFKNLHILGLHILLPLSRKIDTHIVSFIPVFKILTCYIPVFRHINLLYQQLLYLSPKSLVSKESPVQIGLTTRSTATTKVDVELVGWLRVTVCRHGSDWADTPLHAVIGKLSPHSACLKALVTDTELFSYLSSVSDREMLSESPDHLQLQ